MEVEVSESMLNDVKAAMSDIKNGYKAVLVTSINKTVATTKVQATARIGNEMNLKAARIKENLTVQKASYAKMSGALVSKGEPIGLINFGARSVLRGVTAQVLRANPRSLVKHAYIATGQGTSSKLHVFWRANRPGMPTAKKFPVGKKSVVAFKPWKTSKYRFPTDRLTGPRIEDIFAKERVLAPVMTQANYLFLVNVDAKIVDILRRHG